MTPTIGILDSGVGGLSVLKEIQKLIPDSSLHYIADSAWCPYGNKSAKLIQQRVFSLTDVLLDKGCQVVVVACNSATINAVEALRANYLVPFAGMEPAVKPACLKTKSGVIGVLATEASLAGAKFHHLVEHHAGDVKVITRPCPKFVELVERGELSGQNVDDAIWEYTHEMLAEGADVLVLGCTHYPFLKQSIQAIAGNSCLIIDTGEAVAKQTHRLLNELDISGDTKDQGAIEILTSGDLNQLTRILPTLCPGLTASIQQLEH